MVLLHCCPQGLASPVDHAGLTTPNLNCFVSVLAAHLAQHKLYWLIDCTCHLQLLGQMGTP
jgi:hypothetical protein